MAQVKIYGLKHHLETKREQLSTVIHQCVMEVFGMPAGKRAHRFFLMDAANFLAPDGRSEAYTIIEITIIAGRTIETRKRLIRLLFEKIAADIGIQPNDIEICIIESPACNWGFRGLIGDEANLNYAINI